MTEVEQLLAIENIRQLKARYFRFVDTKEWDALSSLFTADSTMDFTDDSPDMLLRGPAAFAALGSTSLKFAVSVHHGHTPEIELTSDDTAKGIWPMDDMIFWNENDENAPKGAGGKRLQSLHGYGHYRETYVRIRGRWYISTLKLTRLRMDVT